MTKLTFKSQKGKELFENFSNSDSILSAAQLIDFKRGMEEQIVELGNDESQIDEFNNVFADFVMLQALVIQTLKPHGATVVWEPIPSSDFIPVT